MQLNRSYSSPSIARRTLTNKPPEKKKSFIQQSPIQAKGGRKRQRHKKKEDIDIALESSFQARSVCASQIKHLREAMTNFDKYTHAMKRREAREKRKRSTAIAKLRNSRNGPDKTLYKEKCFVFEDVCLNPHYNKELDFENKSLCSPHTFCVVPCAQLVWNPADTE